MCGRHVPLSGRRDAAVVRRNGVELLSAARLEEILGKLHERTLLGGEEGVRLSLSVYELILPSFRLVELI